MCVTSQKLKFLLLYFNLTVLSSAVPSQPHHPHLMLSRRLSNITTLIRTGDRAFPGVNLFYSFIIDSKVSEELCH